MMLQSAINVPCAAQAGSQATGSAFQVTSGSRLAQILAFTAAPSQKIINKNDYHLHK
ncbi:hypothetical protein [Serratia fonticola]|uniref:hypothetical protein n=1 Tax=Serratia fonticola TaxID=47917 RepID=UPI003AACD06C